MEMIRKGFVIVLFLLLGIASCKKWVDQKAQTDDRLNRPYCNDPSAVNYNWDFPGKPDNTVCFYPSSVFIGNYSLKDSIYFSDNSLDTENAIATIQFSVYALSKNKIGLVGFCSNNDTLKFTADRFYKATSDSTFSNGQLFCNSPDTMTTGSIQRSRIDSLSKYLSINFTIVSDSATGVRYHKGTAIKQP